MKKNNFIKSIPEMHRRELITKLSALMGSPLVSRPFAFGLAAMLGDEAMAQADAQPTYFLEVNFRDQWDMGCAFVAPSLAKNWANLSKEGGDGVCVFKQPQLVGNHYVTEEGMVLKDHLDTIAVMEIGEAHYGEIHGHEAANALRSPGRSKTQGSGRSDMGTFDVRPKEDGPNGNVTLYSSTPTPAVLHNYFAKQKDQALGNGIVFRSSVRAGTHTFYHHSAGLGSTAQLSRFFSEKDFFDYFDKLQTKPSTDVLSLYSKDIIAMMKRLDTRFLKDIKLTGTPADAHIAALALAAKANTVKLTSSALKLTNEELAYWTDGIPGQFRCSDEENINSCVEEKGTLNMGKIFNYVTKLFKSGSYKSLAVDFDYWDIHAPRDEKILQSQGKQMALPLARLIKDLKDAGIYDRTVIAMYTLDGSRSPRRNSTGELSKNAVVLCGGGIKGGYYGDLRVDKDKDFYLRPDDTGKPVTDGDSIPQGGTYEERVAKMKRVPARDVYKTVAKAMGIADASLEQFPDLKNGKVMSYMLKKV